MRLHLALPHPFPQFSSGFGAVSMSQGKGADAVCSMRIHHHLKQRATCRAAGVGPPDHLMTIMDNCVGQNKSVACFQFLMMLVVCGFCKSVTLMCMISARQLRLHFARHSRMNQPSTAPHAPFDLIYVVPVLFVC